MNARVDRLGRHFFDFPRFFSRRNFKIPLSTKTLRETHFFSQSTMPGVKKGELSTNNRQSAFLILWSQQENGVLGHGLIKEVADFFSVHKSTISRLWRATKNKFDAALDNQDGDPVDVEDLLCDINFFESGRKQTGRKKKWDVQALKLEVRGLNLTQRQNFRMLSSNIGVPYATLRLLMSKGHLRRHSSALKPFLTEENKVARVAHALEEVDGLTLQQHVNGGGGDGEVPLVLFKDMHDRVDVDEKWFYQTEDGKNYILTASEEDDDDMEAAANDENGPN